ncbi:MAG: glycyl radical protein [Desulfobacteraceae bacterium]|nr:glycyl radical protein [Desulfobacteraceae bacterium]
MNKRIKDLKSKSKNAKVSLSHERALLVTDFYETGINLKESIPCQRALCLKHILLNKKIYIGNNELIVGERGPEPKAVPTYPEVCLHSLDDLGFLNDREKIPYKVSEKSKSVYEEKIIPFWTGKTIREKIINSMDKEWIASFEAGMFTEFQEQRSPGHTACGDMIYTKGFKNLKKEIQISKKEIDFYNDPLAYNKLEELKALKIAADALILFAKRHADELKKLASNESDPERKKELSKMVDVCRKVPENAPESFFEALQYYWFLHVGVITELNPWDAFNPGRLDQNLYPFFKKDIDEGKITIDEVKELLCCFWIKFNNHPAPPKVGITAKESSTYVDFCLINLGGVTPDNKDGVNELTYLILDVIEEMRLLQPSSMVQVSKKSPDRFIKKALKIIATGFGQPSVFNTDAIIQEQVLQGKSVKDARKGGASGCVEAGIFGKECYILTGYFNLPKILEITLNNGKDLLTNKQIGIKTGNVEKFRSFEQLFEAYKIQLEYFINVKIKGNNIIEKINSDYMPVPLLSLVTEDCIKNGLDYNSGGARYNTSYIQGVGLGSVTDSLTSLKYNVFDNNNISMKELLKELKKDFNENDELHETLLNKTPKYGNDNAYADDVLKKVFKVFLESVDNRPNAKGGVHRINLLPTTCHVYFGEVTGALPDGRKSKMPFSEGISPVQGADINGPTAVVKSASKIDHIQTGGTLLNQKFLPDLLETSKGIDSVKNLIRSYFSLDGHHIQFNVVSKETLVDAQKNPNNYKDLIVRVAGYSDYFVDLTQALQDEIIQRTDHNGF